MDEQAVTTLAAGAAAPAAPKAPPAAAKKAVAPRATQPRAPERAPAPATVEVPVALLEQLRQRLDVLEGRERLREEAQARRAPVIDEEWERQKAEISRPASVRTQEMADREYGTLAPRFRVSLDPTDENGKPVNVAEHFPLEVSAHSDLEAQARYLKLMGIRKHDYRLVAEPVA